MDIVDAAENHGGIGELEHAEAALDSPEAGTQRHFLGDTCDVALDVIGAHAGIRLDPHIAQEDRPVVGAAVQLVAARQFDIADAAVLQIDALGGASGRSLGEDGGAVVGIDEGRAHFELKPVGEAEAQVRHAAEDVAVVGGGVHRADIDARHQHDAAIDQALAGGLGVFQRRREDEMARRCENGEPFGKALDHLRRLLIGTRRLPDGGGHGRRACGLGTANLEPGLVLGQRRAGCRQFTFLYLEAFFLLLHLRRQGIDPRGEGCI